MHQMVYSTMEQEHLQFLTNPEAFFSTFPCYMKNIFTYKEGLNSRWEFVSILFLEESVWNAKIGFARAYHLCCHRNPFFKAISQSWTIETILPPDTSFDIHATNISNGTLYLERLES